MNGRLDTLQAAVLLVKLRHLDAWTTARRHNAERYTQILAPITNLRTPYSHPDCFHVYNQYTIRTPHRDALRDYLTHAGVGSEIYYPVPLHLQKCFQYLGHRPGDFPEAERAAMEIISLPVYPELPETQINYVTEIVSSFFQSL